MSSTGPATRRGSLPRSTTCGKRSVSLRAHADAFNLDPGAVALWGTSAGATIATIVGASAPSEPERVCAVASWYGMHDPLRSPELRAPGSPLHTAFGAPGADGSRWFRPADHITAESAPTFLLHGTDDRVVPVEQSVSLAATLAEQGVPHEFMLVDGGHHDFAEMSTRTDALTRTYDFLHGHLLARRATRHVRVTARSGQVRDP
ncbi:prolyl oligopeptidase family serine peptidase [Curtobacterium flaccumfaciens]|nr:prolyl oligopeptidase family serine peptidase [Curtobacterium flaccumfaciens]